VAPDEIVPKTEPADPELADPIDELVPAEGLRMPIIEHLRELRVRLIRMVIAIAAGFIVAYFFFRSIIRRAHLADSAGLAR